MNRFAGMAVIVVLALTGAAVYFHFNPNQLTRWFSGSVPGFQVPEPRSPMTNFRPPQF
jgi:hypothetical protein